MKKYLSFIISIFMIFSLIGCGDSPNTNSTTNNKSESQKTENDSNKNEINNDKTENFEENTNSTGVNSTTTDKKVRLFFYNGFEDKIVYKDTTVKVIDGALVTAIIKGLKENYGEDYCSLASNIEVNSAKLEKDKDLLTVNFKKNFINNMNLGSGAESAVLQCVVNSLGYNFNISNIYITIDGKPYSSGHLLYEENETIAVDYSNISNM